MAECGRGNLIARLAPGSFCSTQVNLTMPTGGIGKTQLAARYCWTRQRHHPGGIVWLNMADPAHAVSELVNWAERLRLEVTDASDRAKANAVLGRVRSTDSSGCFR
jgi:hypothetical protein